MQNIPVLSTLALAAAALLAPLPAVAQPEVTLDSAVYVERLHQQNGALVRALEPASRLSRGDRVVTLLNWYLLGGSGGFTVVNRVPPHLSYQQSPDANEDVSVDGGRTWGHLDQLRIAGRHATPEDVTHVRWHVSPREAMSGAGRIAYSGFVH